MLARGATQAPAPRSSLASTLRCLPRCRPGAAGGRLVRNTTCAARQQASSQQASMTPIVYVTTRTEMPALVAKAVNPVFWGGFASAVVVVLAIQKMFPRQRTPKPVYTDEVPAEVWSATSDAPAFSLDGLYTRGKVIRVWNGNTATIVLPLKGELLKFSCRLKGTIVPDLKPARDLENRDAEVIQAQASQAGLASMVLNKVVSVRCHASELAGRQIVELWVDDKTPNQAAHTEENSVNAKMIKLGFARPFMQAYHKRTTTLTGRARPATTTTSEPTTSVPRS